MTLNNRYLKIVLATIVTIGSTLVYGQTTNSNLTKQVEIYKQYSPTIGSAIKREFQPQAIELIKMDSPIFDYSIAYTPQFYRPTFDLLSTFDVSRFYVENMPQGYASVALGAPLNSKANVYYTTRPSENTFGGVWLNHNGFWGKLTNKLNDRIDASDSQTSIGGLFDYRKGNLVFDLKGSYQYDNYNMYGYSAQAPYIPSEIGSNFYNRLNLEANISTPYIDNDSWDANFGARVNYVGAGTQDDLAFYLKGGVAKGFGGGTHTISLDANMLLNSAKNTDYNILYVTPELEYNYRSSRFSAEIGVTPMFTNSYGEPTSILIDAIANYKLKSVKLSAGLRTDYLYNTLDNISRLNPYIAKYEGFYPTTRQAELFFGAEFKLTNWLTGMLDFGYRDEDNRMFFVNIGSGEQFLPLFEDFDYAFGSVAFDIFLMDRLDISTQYNYKDIDCIGVPKHEFGLEANYLITPRVKVRASTNIYSQREQYYLFYSMTNTQTSVESIPTKVNISLGASYKINNWISAALDVDNLLNSDLYQYSNYAGQGISIMLGAEILF